MSIAHHWYFRDDHLLPPKAEKRHVSGMCMAMDTTTAGGVPYSLYYTL